MKNKANLLIFILILGCLVGCGSDDVDDNDSLTVSSAEDGEQIPTVIIEKLGIDILEEQHSLEDDHDHEDAKGNPGRFIAGILRWRLRAIPAPKDDLAVRLNEGYDWVIIPKSQNYSSVFRTLIRAAYRAELDDDILREEGTHRLSQFLRISIDPLPIVPSPDNEVMIDQEQLHKYLPIQSLGKYTIRKGYEFQYYEIGNPSHLFMNRDGGLIFASVVRATPAKGDISKHRRIIVDFNNNPGNVAASSGTVTGTGKSRTISPPDGGYPVGDLVLTIRWGDGEHTFFYTVVAGDETPPEIVSSNPKNREKDVDPAVLLENGIRITFSERVIGNLILLEGNDDIGWSDTFNGNIATLKGNARQALRNNTKYKIIGTVSDGAGNELKVNITFTTKI